MCGHAYDIAGFPLPTRVMCNIICEILMQVICQNLVCTDLSRHNMWPPSWKTDRSQFHLREEWVTYLSQIVLLKVDEFWKEKMQKI